MYRWRFLYFSCNVLSMKLLVNYNLPEIFSKGEILLKAGYYILFSFFISDLEGTEILFTLEGRVPKQLNCGKFQNNPLNISRNKVNLLRYDKSGAI